MFTGIITAIGTIAAVTPRGSDLARLAIASSYERASIAIGASIACNGICLTVVETGSDAQGRTLFMVDAAAETMRVTTARDWRVGRRLNLERALKIGDELGGHIVTGHVDGVAAVIAREDLPDMVRFTLRAPAALSRFIAAKGSVALDGISLTVNTVSNADFSVLIIPHTLSATAIGDWATGAAVNLEVDLMARYAARLVEATEPYPLSGA